MKKELRRWIDIRGFDGDYRIEGFPIRVKYAGHAFGNIFLAGEAAGLVNDVTGIGIYPAYVSGKEIARVILDPSYPAPVLDGLIKSKRLQGGAINIAARFPALSDYAYELIPLMMKSQGIRSNFFNFLSGRTQKKSR